jgi:acyl-CoA reductase-like NAD-dependent aldehyde dehydrogenase
LSVVSPDASDALLIAFLNSGQACAAGTRLLVPKSRFDEVKRAIVDTMPAFPVGDPADPKTAVGPLVNQRQYERVQSYIRKGIEEGAEVLVGGEGRPHGLEAGFFVKPTVFVNVKNDMAIAREEIFGPVLSVITYESEEDAIRIANDTNFGLHAFVSGTFSAPAAWRLRSKWAASPSTACLTISRRRSADSSTLALAANSACTASKRFSNRGQFSNDHSAVS